MSTAFGVDELHGLIEAFSSIEEYRKNLLNVDHKLVDILIISVCGIIAGANGPTAIYEWAEIHEENLTRILKLEHGLPSKDTIRRTLSAIKPKAFQNCFLEWINSFRANNKNETEHVALDGKRLRRSHDKKKHLGALHIVSAWSSEQGITLGQLATEKKSNEITAIPELLESIEIKGAVVTIDAMGTQKKIAQKIINKKADYVLAVKDNQPRLHRAIIKHFDSIDLNSSKVSRIVEEEVSHGRQEHREYYQVTIPEDFREAQCWAGARTIGMVKRTCINNKGKTSVETRYYLCSIRRNGKEFARYVRQHWSIENTLHWSMDVTFGEDACRIRERTIADNLSWIRRFTITLLKQHPGKGSLVGKRRMAAWSFDFLLQLILGNRKPPEFQG